MVSAAAPADHRQLRQPLPQARVVGTEVGGIARVELGVTLGNEAGRAAVNALLDASESNAERVQMFKLYEPPEFKPLKRADAELYRADRPNALDRPYLGP